MNLWKGKAEAGAGRGEGGKSRGGRGVENRCVWIVTASLSRRAPNLVVIIPNRVYICASKFHGAKQVARI